MDDRNQTESVITIDRNSQDRRRLRRGPTLWRRRVTRGTVLSRLGAYFGILIPTKVQFGLYHAVGRAMGGAEHPIASRAHPGRQAWGCRGLGAQCPSPSLLADPRISI
jgi:hypothetical protein